VWRYLAELLKVKPPQVKTNSCLDAPVASGSHPVVVFTHGYTGTFTDYTFLFEDLASRGYIVASVSHTFETTAVEFPDGRLLKSVMGSHLQQKLQINEPSTTLAVAVRLSDLRFVMNQLDALNVREKSPFFAALDMSRVALAGHSLGGMTALLGVELDPRFRAAVSLDGVMPSSWFHATQKPIMMLTAGSDPWSDNACHVWTRLRGPRFALNLSVSPDQRWVSALDPEGLLTAYPVEGGDPVHARSLGPGHLPAGWLANGALLSYERFKVPSQVQSLDLATGRTALFRTVEPREIAGVMRIVRAQVTPDGRATVVNLRRMSGSLLLLDWKQKRAAHGGDEAPIGGGFGS